MTTSNKKTVRRPMGIPGYLLYWATLERTANGCEAVIRQPGDVPLIKTFKNEREARAFLRELWNCDRLNTEKGA